LNEMVASGDFREDLYWRLNVVEVHLPPLRERKEDIELLTKHFLYKYAADLKKPVPAISPEATNIFTDYHWPGNVRELENVLERALTLLEGEKITVETLPTRLRTLNANFSCHPETGDAFLRDRLKHFEKSLIKKVLLEENGNRIKTAEHLGVSLRTLQYKLKEYSIQ